MICDVGLCGWILVDFGFCAGFLAVVLCVCVILSFDSVLFVRLLDCCF